MAVAFLRRHVIGLINFNTWSILSFYTLIALGLEVNSDFRNESSEKQEGVGSSLALNQKF